MTWRPAWLLPDLDEPTTGAVLGRAARAASCSCRRAASCGAAAHAAPADVPALPVDSTCAWEPTSGRGTVWSFIVPHPPLLPAFAEFAPYNAIIVELDEDPTIRFVGNLVASADGDDQRDRSRNDHDRRTRPRRVPPDRRRVPPPLGARLIERSYARRMAEQHLPELPLLDRVKIQAEVLVPLFHACERELGAERAPHPLRRCAA